MLETTHKNMQETAALYLEELVNKWSTNQSLPKSSMKFIQYARKEFCWAPIDCLIWLKDYIIAEHIEDLEIMNYKYYGGSAIIWHG